MNGRNVEDIYELTPLQEGMLYHSVLDPDAAMYTYDYVLELHEEIDIPALEKALARILQRHSILRTSFHYEEIEKPVQVVHRDVSLPLDCRDARGLSGADQEKLVRSLSRGPEALAFDLTEPPLMRIAAVRTGDEVFQLVLVFHHAIVDGWSIPLLIGELARYHSAFKAGQECYLPPPRPYRDFIDWLQQRDDAQDEAFWRDQLKGFSSPTELAIRQIRSSRPAEADFRSQGAGLSVEATENLREFARRNQLSLNTLAQAAWGLLLSRYGGHDDVVFGTSTNGRPPELEGVDSMVGVFINTNPLRVRTEPDQALLPWLKTVQDRLLAIHRFEHTPLVKVHGWSEVPADRPLFESMFVFENYPTREAADLVRSGAVGIRSFGGGATRIGYPIVVTGLLDAILYLDVSYDVHRFSGRELDHMASRLKVMLEHMPAYGDRPVSSLPMLEDAERQQLIDWGSPPTRETSFRWIAELFRAQVDRSPDAVAVVDADRFLSYAELNRRANRLAQALHHQGARPEVLVGICLPRSAEMLIALIGILKAGAAYVPLDPDYPRDRLAAMLNGAGVGIVVTQQALHERLSLAERPVVLLGTDDGPFTGAPCNDPGPVVVHRDNSAYVIFTSGSTGTPNAVIVSHRSLVDYACHAADQFDLTGDDRVLQFASISFDTAAEEIFPSLIRGSTLVIRNTTMLRSVAAFLEACDEAGVTALDLPTSYWHEISAEMATDRIDLPQCIRLVIIGGERARPERLSDWQRQVPAHVRTMNTYGPTETTIVASSCELTPRVGSTAPYNGATTLPEVSMGTPNPNVRMHVLDQHGNLLPAGVAGELFIGGSGLARGYHGRPGLTARKFVPDPFGHQPGQRLYATGDLCWWVPDGRLEYCGRTDHQVKLRGYRLELGEIENVLLQHPLVRDAAVVLRDEPPKSARLVAYVVAPNERRASDSELRSYLIGQLPDYAVPTDFVTLASLPRTPSGKTDRSKLPAPSEGVEDFRRPYRAPRTEVEAAVASVIGEALDVDEVSVDANFFELGGHSLLAIRVWSRLNEMYGIGMPLRTFVELATPEEVALAIEEALLQEIESLSQDQVDALQEGDA